MFKSDKNKILLILKDKLIEYLNEEIDYKDRINDWEKSDYFTLNNLQRFSSKSNFEEHRDKKIRWLYEQLKINQNNLNLIKELIEKVKKV